MSEDGRILHHHHESNRSPPPPSPPPPSPPPPPYGTFEGIATSPAMSQEGRILHHYHESNRSPPPDDSPPPPPPPPVVSPYGTFEGFPTSPAMGFPQPAPPRGSMNPPPDYYARGYQAVPGYAVADGTPVGAHARHDRLPCCGIGFGWFLFIIGFFLGAIPWYAAAIFFLCCRNVDPREKPAYVCCTIAAVLAIIATVFGVTRLND